jgi:hypothetical protein
MTPELSATEVRRLSTTSGFHNVGGVPGLHLQVAGSACSWILRAKIGDKRRDIGLGGFPAVTLAQARDKARQMRELISQGIDPVAERIAARAELEAAQAKMLTFEEAARRFLVTKTREFRNAKHAAQWGNSLAHYAYPVIGRLPVESVELAHMVQILQPIWTDKTETASRLRGRIEAVLA